MQLSASRGCLVPIVLFYIRPFPSKQFGLAGGKSAKTFQILLRSHNFLEQLPIILKDTLDS